MVTESSRGGLALSSSSQNGSGPGLRLGGARADFVAGLGRKVAALRAASTKVREAREEIPRREELRRKLHALSSAAKLMKFDAMDRAIAEALGILDRTAIDAPIEELDLGTIDQVIEDLPALAWGDGEARPSRVQAVVKPSAPKYAALVVGSAHIAEALLEDASAEGGLPPRLTFTCESTPDAQAAFDLARSTEPDLVVLDADLDYASELVEALMDEPRTEAVPVVVVGSFQGQGEASLYVAMGVAKTLTKPTSKATLREACETALEAPPAFARVPVIGTPSSSPQPIDAAYGDRTRVRLRGPAAEVRLQGRRIVVADDDPAVVWFLADLLKTSGCIVHEAFDGKQALDLAYRMSPDLLLCDIMMPEIDGFTLSRQLKRDVALHDMPVILVSWKEDLLQRVRELGAGAAAYIRKESDTRAIVARIREALRPRSRIETRLRDDGEVRGRMDGVSARTLLEIVCATRPEARVTVRDSAFSYEIEIRDGAPQRATRTAGDGAVLEGSRVLAALLGVRAGRFTVATSTTKLVDSSTGDVRDPKLLDGNLSAQLAKPIARARGATMILTGGGLMKADKVLVDRALLDDYIQATPDQARRIALRVADGASPRSLLLEGACAASLLEDIVCDMAARSIVTGVEGDAGEDLLGPEIERLAAFADARAAFGPRTDTPSPLPAGAEHAANVAAANECAADDSGALCESPEPSDVRHAQRAAEAEGRLHTDEHTPAADQIVALAEPTIVDDTTYEERQDDESNSADISIPIDESSRRMPATESRAMKTPLTSVTARDDEPVRVPMKRSWPMALAFMAAIGTLGWAVVHYSGNLPALRQLQQEAPPPPAETEAPTTTSDGVTYTTSKAGSDVAAGQGLLEISAPGDSIILVDGTERGRGGATLPLWAGLHDVRISGAAGEHHRAIDVRSGRIAHIRF